MQRQYCNNIDGSVPEIKFIPLSSPNQQVFLPDLGEALILGEWERQINMLACHAYILVRAFEGRLFVDRAKEYSFYKGEKFNFHERSEKGD